jgi:catechol 2,3-dioxygenase-like lactoylglutathione lyase family enzyme
MDWTLEGHPSRSDIDRSVAFYRDKVGFDLDHDTRNEHMHVVQLTPRGSGCSIVFGDLEVTGNEPWRGPVSLRWVLVHMVEEYARHLGHADLLRQRIDGRVGQ